MPIAYNVWLHVEKVQLDENGEELEWELEDVDLAKLLDRVDRFEAEEVCNELLAKYESVYDIRIPEEEEEKES